MIITNSNERLMRDRNSNWNGSLQIVQELTVLMADLSIFNQNIKGYKWNYNHYPSNDPELKYEEMNKWLNYKIDDIAEKIVTIGYYAQCNFTYNHVYSKIVETKGIDNNLDAAESILNSLFLLINSQMEIRMLATRMCDAETQTLMSDNIEEMERLVWIYSEFLSSHYHYFPNSIFKNIG